MMESHYQKKIIEGIMEIGGWAINGKYTTNGEADLQAGIPCEKASKYLLYCAIEVKTPRDYARVMSAIDDEYNVVQRQKLKPHEHVQMAKIRKIRKRGGLAVVAYNLKQVMDYIGSAQDEQVY